MERSRQDEGELNPSIFVHFRTGLWVCIAHRCGMCPEDTSLLNTEIGDSLVVRAIKQLRRVVVSGRQPLVGCLGLVDNSNVRH